MVSVLDIDVPISELEVADLGLTLVRDERHCCFGVEGVWRREGGEGGGGGV